MNAHIVLVALLAAGLSSTAAASGLSVIAREGTLYAGDQLASDPGGPVAMLRLARHGRQP